MDQFNQMKIAIIAGEESGDIHAYNLIKSIEKIISARFFGLGGSRMKSAGVNILHDLTKYSVVGFFEPVKYVHILMKFKDEIVKKIEIEKPDCIILIDYPGFNLKVAKDVSAFRIPVIYYIPPQLWAWGESRIKKIRKYIKKVISVLPFEDAFYIKRGVNAKFLGHPIVDLVKPTMSKKDAYRCFNVKDDNLVIGLFPGSRIQEVRKLLPIMNEIFIRIRKINNKAIGFLALSDSIPDNELYELDKSIKIIKGKQYDIMQVSDFLILASGSVTLEASIMKVPSVLLYKVSFFTYLIMKNILKVKYIGLTNIIANTEIIPEFIQNNIVIDNIITEVFNILNNKNRVKNIKQEFEKVARKLGEPNVSDRVAREIIKTVIPKTNIC